MLHAASVIGEEFELEQVAGLVSLAGSDLGDALDALVRRGVVAPNRRAGPGAHRFRHILIRDVAYATLPKTERARLHEAFGRLLEAERGGRRATRGICRDPRVPRGAVADPVGRIADAGTGAPGTGAARAGPHPRVGRSRRGSGGRPGRRGVPPDRRQCRRGPGQRADVRRPDPPAPSRRPGGAVPARLPDGASRAPGCRRTRRRGRGQRGGRGGMARPGHGDRPEHGG